MRTKLKSLIITIICFCFLSLPAHHAAANAKYASLVMDADTGRILHQRHANKKRHPASLTKIMTLLMVFEALDKGKLKLRDRIRISDRAAAAVPSKLGLAAGSRIYVRDAIYALVTKSANDVAIAIAEHMAKTEPAFARQMTKRARQIGMKKTIFKNASAFPMPTKSQQPATWQKWRAMSSCITRNIIVIFLKNHFAIRAQHTRTTTNSSAAIPA